MNTQLLIDAVVQQTVVFIAQLATSGGVRAPLAHVANEVFLGLTRELMNQGVKKKVIADMFGVALRTYHRRVRELAHSRTNAGQTLWEAVVEHIREQEPVTGAEIQRRFRNDDPEILSGVLNDLVASATAYRAGRGELAVYRLADEADFDSAGSSREEANRHLVWLHVYRHGPIGLGELSRAIRLSEALCSQALAQLVEAGHVQSESVAAETQYRAEVFEVPLGTTQGWEVAVLDHFQAMVTAVTRKLSLGAVGSAERDIVGGSTFSLDVWPGHPLENEALGTLARIRAELEELRGRVDSHHGASGAAARRRVVFYLGQYVDCDESPEADLG
ncbi:MAG TPA: crosslink repair DNA glycosylase YcaQ family protein [Polyangiaceae bacterium]